MAVVGAGPCRPGRVVVTLCAGPEGMELPHKAVQRRDGGLEYLGGVIALPTKEWDMGEILAVYEGGVLRPLGPVALHEKQRVRLNVQPLEETGIGSWLEGVRALQERIVAERGYLPDSAPDISADRAR